MMDDCIVVVGIALTSMVGAGVMIAAMVVRLAFPGDVARIEQLRRDAAVVDISASEDIAGQVAAANQDIRAMQAYNAQWWSDLVIPDGWDRVQVIEIYQSRK